MKTVNEYRSCVGIVVFNRDCNVFVAKRIDADQFDWPHCWQFPQGGIDEGEDPKMAAFRELREETGIESIECIDEINDWLHYVFPHEFALKIMGGRYKGQRQKWFLMKFHGLDSEINLNQDHPEFAKWEWVSPKEAINRVVPFKLEVYKHVIEYFSTWLK